MEIIAREVNPSHIDFSIYFDDDGLRSISGKNCACYILGSRRVGGFNEEEYNDIVSTAEDLIEEYDYTKNIYEAAKNILPNLILSKDLATKLLSWVDTGTIDTSSIVEFLTLTTGEKWEFRSFYGYSQGDYCEVIYCKAYYSESHITEIGKFWLGCGTEFCIDGCYGYFVIDELRWEEGGKLRNYLAELYGCKPEELKIYLYAGEHIVTDYKLLERVV